MPKQHQEQLCKKCVYSFTQKIGFDLADQTTIVRCKRGYTTYKELVECSGFRSVNILETPAIDEYLQKAMLVNIDTNGNMYTLYKVDNKETQKFEYFQDVLYGTPEYISKVKNKIERDSTQI